jgi:hypothetical protein
VWLELHAEGIQAGVGVWKASLILETISNELVGQVPFNCYLTQLLGFVIGDRMLDLL